MHISALASLTRHNIVASLATPSLLYISTQMSCPSEPSIQPQLITRNPIMPNTLLQCLERCCDNTLPGHRLRGSVSYLSFLAGLCIPMDSSSFYPHDLKCCSLQRFCHYVCPHLLCWTVYCFYLSMVHSVLDKEELCLDVLCFIST